MHFIITFYPHRFYPSVGEGASNAINGIAAQYHTDLKHFTVLCGYHQNHSMEEAGTSLPPPLSLV